MPAPETDNDAVRYLIVDDDTVFRERLARALRQRGCVVDTASDVAQALKCAEATRFNRAIVDLRMPGGSGLDLVRALHALQPATEVVMLTGYGSIATAVDAIKLGAIHYLSKPADVEAILAAFDQEAAPEATAAPTPAWTAPSLARTEWEHIQRVMADCGGNISEASRRLGMHRRSLQRKLQKYPPRH